MWLVKKYGPEMDSEAALAQNVVVVVSWVGDEMTTSDEATQDVS